MGVRDDGKAAPTARPVAIVQARLSSTRLPGKVLADLGGEPVLAVLLRRLHLAEEVGEVVLATSDEESDGPVAQLGHDLEIEVHRGPLHDTLSRFVGALGDRPGPVVRITGDCPLLDPGVVDRVIHLFDATPECAYASNVDPRSFPDGLDVEVISRAALLAVDADDLDPSDREHVTPAIRRDPARFASAALLADDDLRDLRWTLDTADDLTFIRAVLDRLGPRRHTAACAEVLAAIRQPPSLADFRGRRG